MSTNNGGWSYSPYTMFGFSSGGCLSDTCCVTNGGAGTDEWAVRATDISSYGHIRLRIHISTYLLYAGSTCNIYYSFSSGDSSDKILIKTIDPPDNTGDSRYWYPNTIIDFPYSPSSKMIWIWLYSDSPSPTQTDFCIWDDVYLQGTPPPTPQPTAEPTMKRIPTVASTKTTSQPTKTLQPSPIQTKTTEPTKARTLTPTVAPSIQTNMPSIRLTNAPSIHPINVPTVYPTTAAPDDDDTIHPAIAPSSATTQSLNPSLHPTNTPLITTTPDSGTHIATSYTPKTSTYGPHQSGTTLETQEYIVTTNIEFEYKCSLKCDVIPFNTLYAICHSISDDLLQNDIRRIEGSCVDKIEYMISINPHTQYVHSAATIHVCNDNTLSVLLDAAPIVIQQPILIDSYLNNIPQTTTFSVFHSTYFEGKVTDSDQTFVLIVSVFGSVLTICIVVAVIACVKNARKDIARNEQAIPMKHMNKKKQARYRVQTMSESKPPQQKNALKEALSDEDYDDFMAPEPYQMSVNALSPSVHVQIPVSMPKFGAGQISVESGTMSPYSSVVARE
eukprot:273571_1